MACSPVQEWTVPERWKFQNLAQLEESVENQDGREERSVIQPSARGMKPPLNHEGHRREFNKHSTADSAHADFLFGYSESELIVHFPPSRTILNERANLPLLMTQRLNNTGRANCKRIAVGTKKVELNSSSGISATETHEADRKEAASVSPRPKISCSFCLFFNSHQRRANAAFILSAAETLHQFPGCPALAELDSEMLNKCYL